MPSPFPGEDIAITETIVIKPDVAVQQRQIQEAAMVYAPATEATFTTAACAPS